MSRSFRSALAAAVLVVSVAGAATEADAADPDNAVARYHETSALLVDRVAVAAGQVLTVATTAPIPNTATAAVVEVRALNYTTPGVVMANDCTTPVDPFTDGVQRMGKFATPNMGDAHQSIVPVANGQLCLVSTVDVTLSVVAHGYVDTDPSGLVYRDEPDVVVYDGEIPGIVPIAGIPASGAYALWVTGRTEAGSPEAQVAIGPCGGPNGPGQVIVGPGPDQAFSGSAVFVPADGTPACLYGKGSGTARVELAGVYDPAGPPSSLGPPQVRYRQTTPPRFVGTDPTRALDTRLTRSARVDAGGVERLDLSSALPTGTTAVTLNATVTDPLAAGFLTLYACEDGLPLASNVNYRAGQTVANAATVTLAASRQLCLYTSAAAHIVVDLSGWFVLDAGDGFRSVVPQRAFDTRDAGPVLAAGTTWVHDFSSVVDAGASSIVLNVTVTEPVFDGFVTVYPCGGSLPTVSSVNVARGATAANLVTVRLPADRRVCFYTQVPAHLIADVSGWYTAASDVGFVDLEPSRLFDTREGDATPQQAAATGSITFVRDAEAWLMNVTVDQPGRAGFVTVYPCDTDRPLASNLNFATGATVPNLVVGRPSADRRVCFYTHARTHLLADLAGYYTSDLFTLAFLPDGFDRG